MANIKKCIYIYTEKNARVELVKDKTKPRSSLKGIIDFVHYLRYRDSVPGEYTLFSKKLSEIKSQFFSQYNIVTAAGGIVLNENNEVLLIKRRGFWDLPKGKFEKGEGKKQCALREVEEETGVSGLEIVSKLQLYFNNKHITYHTYRYKRKPTIKPTYWYVMKAPKQKLVPQTEEDIEKAVWVKQKDLESYFSGAYPAIVDVLKSISNK